MTHSDRALATRFLDVIEHDIVPLTRAGVARGDKVFGGAILRKSDLALVIAATNRETENPLFHGEISTLNAFFALPGEARPAPEDCLFLSTHEPCSLCLSAITWAGFDNFHYLFGYVDTRDAFNIPHDLRILSEVFRIENGDYARENAFWRSRSVEDLIGSDGGDLSDRISRIRVLYDELSSAYQGSKDESDIRYGKALSNCAESRSIAAQTLGAGRSDGRIETSRTTVLPQPAALLEANINAHWAVVGAQLLGPDEGAFHPLHRRR